MKRKSINWFKVRIIFLWCLLFFCFVLIVGRMFQLQVLKKEQLYKLAARQQHVQIPLVPKRGTVYDSKGNELAVSIEVDSVYADARKVADAEKTANELASILQIDRKELKLRLKSHHPFEWVQRKISSKEAEQIKNLKLPGIFFLRENRRFYPNSQLAAHLVGFVGLDSKGLEGIEFQYDALLNGENQVWTAARDALGREIAMGKVPFEKEDHYRNIVLTIDKPIQHITETELDRGVEKWGAKGGMAIAMDPSTGKVLADRRGVARGVEQIGQPRPELAESALVQVGSDAPARGGDQRKQLPQGFRIDGAHAPVAQCLREQRRLELHRVDVALDTAVVLGAHDQGLQCGLELGPRQFEHRPQGRRDRERLGVAHHPAPSACVTPPGRRPLRR